VRERESRVPGDRLLEVLHAEAEILLGAAVPEVPPLEPRLTPGLEQPDAERAADRPRDLVLNREDIFRLAVEALRPEEKAVGDVDELGGDPETGARPAHAPLEDGAADLEPAADLPGILGPALEGEARGARDHVQPAYFGERVDQLVGHPVGEVLVIRGWAQVGEWQYGDRGLDSAGRLPPFPRPVGPGLPGPQRVGECGGGGEPVRGHRGERAEDDPVQLLGDGPSPTLCGGHRLGETLGDDGLSAGSGEGWLAGEHLEEDAAEAVHVAPPVQAIGAARLLGAHVGRGAERQTSLRSDSPSTYGMEYQSTLWTSSPTSPESWTGRMLGCCRRAAVRTSRRNRWGPRAALTSG